MNGTRWVIPLDSYRDHAQAIGQIISYWANLEVAVCDLLTVLLDMDYKKTRIIFYSMNNRARIALMLRLSEEFYSAQTFYPKIKRIMRRFKSLSNYRNDLAHGQWSILPDPNGGPDETGLKFLHFGKSALNRKLVFKEDTFITLNRLGRIRQSMENFYTDVIDLTDEIYKATNSTAELGRLSVTIKVSPEDWHVTSPKK